MIRIVERAFTFLFLLVLSAAIPPVSAQSSQEPTPHSQGVVSTGGAHAAVLDSEKRPITAGGFVDSGPVVFENVAERTGVTRWRHVMGPAHTHKEYILETVGSGVALLEQPTSGG